MRHNYSSYVQMLTSQQKFLQVGMEKVDTLVAVNDDKADAAAGKTKAKNAPDA
ncbi:MAG: hypothetical protein PW788_08995 [Micavibrio sp.]|nr:hypothetical protein [Micavibrio sp.]